MTTDAAGDPQLQVGWGLLSFHGSTSTDRINVDDDVPASVTGVTTDTFDIDDSALQGTLNLVGDQSAAGRVADTFEVTNTPAIGLSTDLTGGTGPNTFDIVHGGVNRDIVVSGGSGSNYARPRPSPDFRRGPGQHDARHGDQERGQFGEAGSTSPARIPSFKCRTSTTSP